jgi:hypothetical protein
MNVGETHGLTCSEAEGLVLRKMDKRPDDRFKKIDRFEFGCCTAPIKTGEKARSHDGLIADDGDQPSTRAQAGQNVFGHKRYRS